MKNASATWATSIKLLTRTRPWYDKIMTTLAEIEAAADALPQDQKRSLLNWLAMRVDALPSKIPASHSVLDIAPVSVGKVIRLPNADDDLFGEMLEDRR